MPRGDKGGPGRPRMSVLRGGASSRGVHIPPWDQIGPATPPSSSAHLPSNALPWPPTPICPTRGGHQPVFGNGVHIPPWDQIGPATPPSSSAHLPSSAFSWPTAPICPPRGGHQPGFGHGMFAFNPSPAQQQQEVVQSYWRQAMARTQRRAVAFKQRHEVTTKKVEKGEKRFETLLSTPEGSKTKKAEEKDKRIGKKDEEEKLEKFEAGDVVISSRSQVEHLGEINQKDCKEIGTYPDVDNKADVQLARTIVSLAEGDQLEYCMYKLEYCTLEPKAQVPAKPENFQEAAKAKEALKKNISTFDTTKWLFNANCESEQFPQVVLIPESGQRVYEVYSQGKGRRSWSALTRRERDNWKARCIKIKICQKEEADLGMVIPISGKELQKMRGMKNHK